jgi:hypothetical protein
MGAMNVEPEPVKDTLPYAAVTHKRATKIGFMRVLSFERSPFGISIILET